MVEALDEAHAAATHEPRADPVAESVDVEQREHGEVAVVAGDAPARDEIRRVRCKDVMREDGAFGATGRAGRVDDGGGVVAVDGHPDPVTALLVYVCGEDLYI